MNMVWHLLWKDIRRFKWWLVAWFGLIGVMLAANQPLLYSGFAPDSIASAWVLSSMVLLANFLPIFQIIWIIGIVQEDPLIDSTTFWRTRPVSWQTIFFSKTLFIFLLIILPQIVSVILMSSGQNMSFVYFAKIIINGEASWTTGWVLILSVWLAALCTRRLSSAVILLSVVCLIFFVSPLIFSIMFGVRSHFCFDRTMFSPAIESRWLIQNTVSCVALGTIITFLYSKLLNIRRAIPVACVALIIAVALGNQWSRAIIPMEEKFTSDSGNFDSKWRSTNNGTAKTFSMSALNPIILPINNGCVITASGYSHTHMILTRLIQQEVGCFARCLRLDFDGKTNWKKEYTPKKRAGFIDGRCNAICPASAGGYLLGGFQKKTERPGQTESSKGDESAWLWKIDEKGEALWEKLIGSGAHQRINSVISISNGEYLVCGVITPQNQKAGNVWIAKFSADGNILWEKNYGGKKNSWGFDIQSTTDGGYAACGYTTGTNGYIAAWLLKLEKNGNLIWNKTFPSDKGSDIFSVISASDDGYVMRGWKKTDATDIMGWIFKTDSAGSIIWEKTFEDSIDADCPATGGGYFIAGRKKKNAWLAKLDADGNMKYKKVFQKDRCIYSIKRLQNGKYLAAGNASGSSTKLWLFRFDDSANTK